MNTLGRTLALAAFVIAALAGTSARADDGDGKMMIGTQVAVAGGVRFLAPSGPVDRDLALAGWPGLAKLTPDAALRFGLTFAEMTLDVHFSGFDLALAAPTGSTRTGEYHRGAIGADFGTRFAVGHGVQLAPFVGIGTVKTTLCFAGTPSGKSSPKSPAFTQIVENPGVGACLAKNVPALDLGLAAPFTVWSRRDPGDGLQAARRFTLGPKLSYTIDLTRSRGWSTLDSSEFPTALPKFSGPVGPAGGAYVGVEGQFVFGLARAPRR